MLACYTFCLLLPWVVYNVHLVCRHRSKTPSSRPLKCRYAVYQQIPLIAEAHSPPLSGQHRVAWSQPFSVWPRMISWLACVPLLSSCVCRRSRCHPAPCHQDAECHQKTCYCQDSPPLQPGHLDPAPEHWSLTAYSACTGTLPFTLVAPVCPSCRRFFKQPPAEQPVSLLMSLLSSPELICPNLPVSYAVRGQG